MVFDISDMGEQIRPVGLQVVLEYVWQRVGKNKENGIRTWVWVDEFSIMFNDGAGRTTHRSGEFFAKVYKRIRKYGGVPTAITQNITEVLTSAQARTMISNSEFVMLLQQKKDRTCRFDWYGLKFWKIGNYYCLYMIVLFEKTLIIMV